MGFVVDTPGSVGQNLAFAARTLPMDAYDAIPYDRISIPETHPEQLAALASLFGVEARDPARCRVLELGCAAGGNLIPLAWYLRESRFLGIELSASQAEEGSALIGELGLENIEIRQGDAARAELGDERFDYIIAHGLYSWVPAPVREGILKLIARHLADTGVAYLSFNALPGWRLRGMLRDMLLHHVQEESQPGERLAAAREFLPFLDACLQDQDALSAQILRHEITRLGRAPDSHLYHEYLAEVNEPFLFRAFVDQVRAEGLDYLCNAELHYQFPESLGESVAGLFQAIDDPVERQQYLDFVLNRNFHQALLVRAGTPTLAAPDYERFARLAFHADLTPPRKLDLRKAKAQDFRDPVGEAHPVSHPLTKAALAHLAQVYPMAVAYAELEAAAARQVQAAGDPRLAAQAEHLFGELFHLYARRVVQAAPVPGGGAPVPTERPRATGLARLEARFGRIVGPRLGSLGLDGDAAALLGLLDGDRTRADLVQALAARLGRRPAEELALMLRLLARQGALEG